MNFIEDFNKLHISVKSASLTIIAQVPFFFIVLYLFKKSIIEKIDNTYFVSDLDFYFVLCVCVALSITWFAMNLILSVATVWFYEKMGKPISEPDVTYLLTSLYALGYLSVAILVNYFILWDFTRFVLFIYSFIIFRLVWLLMVYGIASLRQKYLERTGKLLIMRDSKK